MLTSVESLVAFEAALMEWMSALSTSALAESGTGRRVLSERQRLYETVNVLVSDARAVRCLPPAHAFDSLRESLQNMPTEVEHATEVLGLLRGVLVLLPSRATS